MATPTLRAPFLSNPPHRAWLGGCTLVSDREVFFASCQLGERSRAWSHTHSTPARRRRRQNHPPTSGRGLTDSPPHGWHECTTPCSATWRAADCPAWSRSSA